MNNRDTTRQSDESREDAVHVVDQSVRNHLDACASREDIQSLSDRVFASANLKTNDQPVKTLAVTEYSRRPRRRRLWKRMSWVAATAATIAIAFAIGRWDNSASASPADVVRASLSIHSAPIERCYVVKVDRSWIDESDVPPLRDVRVWTQGDRFWVESKQGERSWAWGHNGDGDIWMTLGPHRAIRIDADEVGEPLSQMCDLYSLELESLLQNLLKNFELEQNLESASTHEITARPRHRWGRVRKVSIEVDKETKAIRHLELQRNVGWRRFVTISFTLADSRSPQQAMYEPAGHLRVPFRVLSKRVAASRRQKLLVTWFGPKAGRWIREPADATAG